MSKSNDQKAVNYGSVPPGRLFWLGSSPYVRIEPSCEFAGDLREEERRHMAVCIDTGVLTVIGPDTAVEPTSTNVAGQYKIAEALIALHRTQMAHAPIVALVPNYVARPDGSGENTWDILLIEEFAEYSIRDAEHELSDSNAYADALLASEPTIVRAIDAALERLKE